MPLARSSKEAFFAPFAKNALRAAFAGVVSAFWKRPPHFARGLAKNYASRDGCGLKDVKNASFEERAKVKVKTLGEESPRPSLYFYQ
ncbi:MAG: hypothetical protein H7834_15000 [Magnetococcus sp. YQC-9]